MKTKLTLYLEKSMIELLKQHAKSLGLSLSQFIEKEFSFLKEANSVNEPLPDYFKKMQFKERTQPNQDWKKDRGDYLEEKYG